MGLTIASSPDLHFRPSHGYPFVFGRIKPRETQVVSSIKVSMLAVRKPPATFVVGCAVRVADVSIRVYRAELHPVLVLERIAGVTTITFHVQPVTILSIRHAEYLVLCHPALPIDVPDVHPQRRTVVARQAVERFISYPEFSCNNQNICPVNFASGSVTIAQYCFVSFYVFPRASTKFYQKEVFVKLLLLQ